MARLVRAFVSGMMICILTFGVTMAEGDTTLVSEDSPKPKAVISIKVNAHINFDTPVSPANTLLENPKSATSPIFYTLSISVAELLRQAGITGYDADTYRELSSQQGFDPETHTIPLCQTEPIEPGESIAAITLDPLPDGTMLPAGRYQGNLQQVALESGDPSEQDGSSISVSIKMGARIPFTIQTGLTTMTPDADGTIAMHIFNPVSSESDMIYCLLVSQAELDRIEQGINANEPTRPIRFDERAEYVTLFTSEKIAPGQALTEARIDPLPGGNYDCFLARYEKDAVTGELILIGANTRVSLVIQ